MRLLSAQEAAQRLLRAAGRMARVDQVQTARRYVLLGARSADELQTIASRVLANDCIETWFIHGFGRKDTIPDAFTEPPVKPFHLRTLRFAT